MQIVTTKNFLIEKKQISQLPSLLSCFWSDERGLSGETEFSRSLWISPGETDVFKTLGRQNTNYAVLTNFLQRSWVTWLTSDDEDIPSELYENVPAPACCCSFSSLVSWANISAWEVSFPMRDTALKSIIISYFFFFFNTQPFCHYLGSKKAPLLVMSTFGRRPPRTAISLCPKTNDKISSKNNYFYILVIRNFLKQTFWQHQNRVLSVGMRVNRRIQFRQAWVSCHNNWRGAP